MAEALTIYNVAGTINLMSGGSQTGTGYFSDFTPSIGAGRDPDSTTTDTFPMYVNGTSRADLANKINTLQQYFEQARVWQDTGTGPRTFVSWTPEGYASARRSEIVFGNYALRDGFKTQFSGTATHRALIDVEVTRRNWWEGAEAQVSLTNSNGTDNTSGLNVSTYNDLSGTAPTIATNFFDITAAKISGDLPSPTRLQFTSSSVATFCIDVGMSSGTLTSNTAHFTQSITSVGGSSYVASGYAGTGYYVANAEGTCAFTYAPQMFTDFGDVGNYQIYASLFFGTGDDVKVTPRIKSMGGNFTDIPEFYIGGGTTAIGYRLGVAKYPASPNTLWPVNTFYVHIASGQYPINIDFVEFVRSDQHREITTPTAYPIVDDGIDTFAAWDVYASGETNYFGSQLLTKGKQIFLHPGKNHRVYFMILGGDPISGVANLKLYYRPRYLCL